MDGGGGAIVALQAQTASTEKVHYDFGHYLSTRNNLWLLCHIYVFLNITVINFFVGNW